MESPLVVWIEDRRWKVYGKGQDKDDSYVFWRSLTVVRTGLLFFSSIRCFRLKNSCNLTTLPFRWLTWLKVSHCAWRLLLSCVRDKVETVTYPLSPPSFFSSTLFFFFVFWFQNSLRHTKSHCLILKTLGVCALQTGMTDEKKVSWDLRGLFETPVTVSGLTRHESRVRDDSKLNHCPQRTVRVDVKSGASSCSTTNQRSLPVTESVVPDDIVLWYLAHRMCCL